MTRLILILLAVWSSTIQAADGVPFTASSVKSVGGGFIEIVGPGKIMVNGEGINGCMLHYSSEGYTENISLIDQSCEDALDVINESRE